MSQERELYANLIDETTESSAALSKIVEGSDVDNIDGSSGAAKGSLAFSFKDSSGNAVLPQLNEEGAQVVTFDAGTTKRTRGKVDSGSQTKDARSQIAEIILTLEKNYTGLSCSGTATRLTLFEIVQIDDFGGTPTETILGDFICSSGQYNYKFELKQDIFSTVGNTGVQKVVVYGTPLDKVSDFFAAMSINEIA